MSLEFSIYYFPHPKKPYPARIVEHKGTNIKLELIGGPDDGQQFIPKVRDPKGLIVGSWCYKTEYK